MQKEVKKIEELEIELRKNKALNTSIKEGTFAGMSTDLGTSIITPLATEIGSNALHIGLLSSLPSLISPLAQIKGDRMMEKHSRKSIVSKFVLWQALMWIPIALMAILFSKNIMVSWLPWLLIILFTIFTAFGGLAHPAWFSWMGDLTDETSRGRYFARRNVVAGIAGTVMMLLGGALLKYFKTAGILFIGFGILFFLAFVFRYISHLLLKRQYEPNFKLNKKDYFSFWSFLKRYDSFGKFAVYQAFFNLAIMVASPFFALYMLKNLGYQNNYLLYMVVTLSSTGFYLLFSPLAGRFSDRYGNLKMLWVANIIFAINPFLWLFIKTPLQIIFIPQLIVGLANACFTIGTTNYIYNSVSQKKRGLCIAYTNLLIGIGVLIGSLIGGVLIDVVSGNAFFVVFIIAAVLRLLVGLIFLPVLKEPIRKEAFRLHVPIHFHLSNSLRYLNNSHLISWIPTEFKRIKSSIFSIV